MIYLLMMMFVLCGFAAPAFGSEKNSVSYKFTVYVRDNEPLVSCDKQYIDFFNETCGTQYKYEDPFLPVYDDAGKIGKYKLLSAIAGDSYKRPDDWIHVKKNVIESIKFIPFKFFLCLSGVKDADEPILHFSKKDEDQKKCFYIYIASRLITADKPNVLLENFRNNINKSKQETTTKKDDINEFEKLAFFHAHFNKFLGGSLVVIVLYALCKKFYTAAS